MEVLKGYLFLSSLYKDNHRQRAVAGDSNSNRVGRSKLGDSGFMGSKKKKKERKRKEKEKRKKKKEKKRKERKTIIL